jgi:small-conductance mechanosensitive channel
MTNDEQFLDRAAGRIGRTILILAAAGVLATAAWGGWRWAAGFALGAFGSWFNFWWVKRIVHALGPGGRPRTASAVFAGLRYLLLGGAAYVILRYSPISLGAVLAGLFVAAGAVIVEILFELLYARST